MMTNRKYCLRSLFSMLSLGALSFAAQVAMAEPTEVVAEILGDWSSVEMRCLGTKKSVPNIEIEGIFKPRSRLHVERSGNDHQLYRVSKSLTHQSCVAAEDVPETLMTSTFLAGVHNVKRDKDTNGMRSASLQGLDLISYKIDRGALMACHPVVAALSYFKFPGYFAHEAKRQYHLFLRGDNLMVYFNDPDICRDGFTRVIYRRPSI